MRLSPFGRIYLELSKCDMINTRRIKLLLDVENHQERETGYNNTTACAKNRREIFAGGSSSNSRQNHPGKHFTCFEPFSHETKDFSIWNRGNSKKKAYRYGQILTLLFLNSLNTTKTSSIRGTFSCFVVP